MRKLTILLASTLTVMAGATIAPSLPQIQSAFAVNANAAILTKLVLTMPAIFIAIFSPISGWVADKYGRLPLLFTSLILYGIAGSSGFYLDELSQILIGRAALGIGVAGVMNSITTLIGDYYEGEERNQLMGLQASFMSFGGFVFISLGGGLADIGWRWPFSLYLFSFLILPFAVKHLAEPVKASQLNATSDVTLDTTTRNRIFMLYGLTLALMILFYLLPVQLPFLLKQMGVVSGIQSGLAVGSSILVGGIVSLFYRNIKSRFTFNQIYAFLFLFAGLGFLGISQSNSFESILLAQLVGGFGFGLFMPNTTLCLMNSAPVALRGRIIGGMSMAVFGGQFISPLVAQPAIDRHGISFTFLIGGVLFLAFSLIYFFSFLRNRLGNTR